ncbi:MAG: ClC family H(+)/Cl(-) exchange transporter [Clostridia bacterium]|nr:ClC family H(+)/Cl(-) exchange transporter [Clostridia bacterium]
MKHQGLTPPRYRLIWEGILIGILSGAVTIFYRWLLGICESGRGNLLSFFTAGIDRMILWFLILVVIAWVVSLLLQKEPMISGSGIPQIEGEFHDKLKANPLRVLCLKMIGGSLSILGGLSLGREGPSIQLGGMGGMFVSNRLHREGEEKNFLLLCGAAAGLSAAFNAPLAGVLFAIEEVYKTISPSLLFSVMVSSVSADYLSKLCFGTNSVFSFPLTAQIPLEHYWILLVVGVVVGLLGFVYNKTLLFTQKQFQKLSKPFFRLLIPFVLAGILGFYFPQVLGGGHNMVELLLEPEFYISFGLGLLLVKFVFSVISFGSGAPGGIFFPLLVLGAYIGAITGTVTIEILGLDSALLYQFVVLAMAGYFTAIVHAPLTGIILLCEMTGSFTNLLPVSLVCIVSYIVTKSVGNKPIYDSLLERMLEK